MCVKVDCLQFLLQREDKPKQKYGRGRMYSRLQNENVTLGITQE